MSIPVIFAKLKSIFGVLSFNKNNSMISSPSGNMGNNFTGSIVMPTGTLPVLEKQTIYAVEGGTHQLSYDTGQLLIKGTAPINAYSISFPVDPFVNVGTSGNVFDGQMLYVYTTVAITSLTFVSSIFAIRNPNNVISLPAYTGKTLIYDAIDSMWDML